MSPVTVVERDYLQLYKMTFIKKLFVILLDNVQWNQLCHWKNSVQ